MLEYFFCDYLSYLMQNDFPYCYTVFSGGDDLLIVGPWQSIIKLALKIQKDFTAFCGKNSEVTISAGITVFSHKTPVFFAVREAEQALESAKENGNQNQEGRNQLCLFGREMKWSRAHNVLAWGDKVANWNSNRKLTSGDIYKMRTWDIICKLFAIMLYSRTGGRIMGNYYNPQDRQTISEEYKSELQHGYFDDKGALSREKFERTIEQADQDYMGIKYENVISRSTGRAEHPRPIEFVPSGTEFILNISLLVYDDDADKNYLELIKKALCSVEDTYLGG
jgi:hypothetical protein